MTELRNSGAGAVDLESFGCAKKYAGVPSKRALKTGAVGSM